MIKKKHIFSTEGLTTIERLDTDFLSNEQIIKSAALTPDDKKHLSKLYAPILHLHSNEEYFPSFREPRLYVVNNIV